LSNGNQTLALLPNGPLPGATTYTLTVAGLADLSGHVMSAPVTTTFTTGPGVDFSPPAALQVDSRPPVWTGVPTNALMRVHFSKQVTVTAGNLLVYPTGGNFLPGSVGVSADGLTATWTPTSPLQVETQYGVYLTGDHGPGGAGAERRVRERDDCVFYDGHDGPAECADGGWR